MLSVSKQLFEKISVCVELGYNLLILEDDVYIYTTFDASTSSNVSSIDFCSVTVVCISDFLLNTQISELMNRTLFKNKLMDKIDSLGKPVRMRFNKVMPYIQYSSF